MLQRTYPKRIVMRDRLAVICEGVREVLHSKANAEHGRQVKERQCKSIKKCTERIASG